MFESKFRRGDKVHCDDDETIRMKVCGHLFRESFIQIECSWFANGAIQTAWIEEWRLTNAKI